MNHQEPSTTDFSRLATPRAARPSVLASWAAVLGLRLEDSFFCQICYDDVSVAQSYTLTTCGHRFCSTCLQSYLAFNIQEGETELKCFFQDTTKQQDAACLASIPVEEVERLVDAATFAKYKRFLFNKQHTNARECPYCDHNQLCDGSRSMDCTCESCGRVFCFIHSNAHPGMSCSSYKKRTRKDEKHNLSAINRLCKACPGCGQFVEKDGGCNQVKCWACKTNFCWNCREVVDQATFSNHYQWWNIGGCAGNQLANLDDMSQSERIVVRFFQGIFLVIVGPPAFVLAAISSLICCCWYPVTKVYNVSYRQAFASCICVSVFIVLFPLLLSGALLFLPCLMIAFWASPHSFEDAWRNTTGRAAVLAKPAQQQAEDGGDVTERESITHGPSGTK